jgi:hypothetical protein
MNNPVVFFVITYFYEELVAYARFFSPRISGILFVFLLACFVVVGFFSLLCSALPCSLSFFSTTLSLVLSFASARVHTHFFFAPCATKYKHELHIRRIYKRNYTEKRKKNDQ